MKDRRIGICADYDSMGNHGRFPMRKATLKRNLFSIIIEKILSILK